MIYLTGGLVLALRLFFADTEWEIVIGQLPREVLISIGMAEVVLPSLAVAALYGAFRLKGGSTAIGPQVLKEPWTAELERIEKGKFAATAVVIGGLLVLPGGIWAATAHDPGKLTLLPVAWAISSLLAWAALNARARIWKRFPDEAWNGLRAVALMMVVVALVVIPGSIAFWAARPLSDARVCVVGQTEPVDGLFIGETSNRVYVAGFTAGSDPREISSIPTARIERVRIGPDAEAEGCPAPTASGSTPTPNKPRPQPSSKRNE